MKMPVADYLNSLKENPQEHRCLTSIYDECQQVINFLHAYYQVIGPIPICIADTSLIIKASVRNGEIAISRGLIDLALSAAVKMYFGESGENRYVISQFERYEKIGVVFWIVAHEYFHFARGHAKLWKDEELRLGLEYDADCYAVAGLYRYISSVTFGALSNVEVKKIVMKSFYWPMREIIGIDSDNIGNGTDHPFTHVRLMYSIGKLDRLDNTNGNLGLTKAFADEIQLITNCMVEYEEEYIKKYNMHNAKRNSNFIDEYRSQYKNSESHLKSIVSIWTRIETIVQQASLLLGDQLASGHTLLYMGDAGAKFLKNGWIYSARDVRGHFKPAFHSRPGATSPDNYGEPRIIPNAYWTPSQIGPGFFAMLDQG